MVEYCSCCTYMHSFCHLLRITVSLMQTCTWICRQLFDILFYGFEKANKLSSFILLNRKTLKLVFKQLGVWQINFFYILSFYRYQRQLHIPTWPGLAEARPHGSFWIFAQSGGRWKLLQNSSSHTWSCWWPPQCDSRTLRFEAEA